MDSDDFDRADHRPYIAAVRQRLEAGGIRAGDVLSSRQGGRRAAVLLVVQDDDPGVAAEGRGDASLCWDEEDGWSLRVRLDESDLSSGVPVYKGLGVVPEPEDVAVWVAVLLAHPEVTPSREDHPFRDHLTQDRAFEELLARYSPAG